MTVQIILTALIGAVVANAAFRKGRLAGNLAIIRQYRPVHFLTSIPLIAAIAAAWYGLRAASPVFDINPVLWVIAKLFHAGSGHGQQNLIFSGLSWRWYAAVFLPVLILAFPCLAQIEEETYRARTRNWTGGFLRSLRFGLAHMLMLIPFGASLALTLAGLWFTRQYFKGGTERSTLYHAAFNTTLVIAVFAIVVIMGGQA